MDRGKGMKERKAQFYLVMAAILICVGIYQMIHISGPVMYPDEFGYWANAAQWIGFDWSEVVSLQSYYSFGYSILLAPFLAFIKNPMLMYKAAVLLNMLLVYLHGVLLYGAAMELADDGKRQDWLFCLMAACYPSLLFYMQVTLTESLLSFLYMLSIWLLLRYIKAEKFRYSILLTVVLAYMYFVHMRTIGILLAGMLIHGWFMFKSNKTKRNKVIAAILILGLMSLLILLGNEVKGTLLTELYKGVNNTLLDFNDYGGQILKIKYLFSIEGIKDFVISGMGKLFYLGIATCGTLYFGVYFMFQRMKKEIIYGFILMSLFFTFLIAAVYTMKGSRADSFINGRYNEIVIPIVIFFGLYEMAHNRYLFRIAAVITVLQGVLACILAYAMSNINPRGFQGYFAVSITYILKEIMPSTANYIFYPYVIGSVVFGLLILVMGLFIRRRQNMRWYLVLFVSLYIYTSLSAGNKFIYDHSMDTTEDMAMMEAAMEKMKDDERIIFVLSKSDAQYIDILQFCLKAYVLHVITEEDAKLTNNNHADFVFTYRENKMEGILRERYDRVMETFHFKFYYN